MKKPVFILGGFLIVIVLAGNLGTLSKFIDSETSTGNKATGWTSSVWTQTTQADFESGLDNNIDTATTPGNASLDSGQISGWLSSAVFNGGVNNLRWDALVADVNLPADTAITFEVRASDTAFNKEDGSPSWNAIGSPPVNSGLPAGRYFQWRATLSTSNVLITPTLQEVRSFYFNNN